METSGYCIYSDQDGDQIYMQQRNYKGKSSGAGVEVQEVEVNYVVIGGTGKYQGVTGSNQCIYKDVGFREVGSYIEGEGVSSCQGSYQLP